MCVNKYYRQVFGRKNALKDFLLTTFLGLASWPRLLLEVFVRKNFGERYFSFSTAIIIIVILAFMPFSFGIFHPFSYGYRENGFFIVIGQNILWYLFLAGFFYTCLQRRKEIQRSKSSFDFGRFSLASGDLHLKFKDMKINGKEVDVRLIETVLEPALFFAIGLFLTIIGQSVGILLLVCSIIYSLSYFGSYYVGDNFILDTIDEMICNEELGAFFIEGRDSRDTRGFRPYARTPADEDMRRKMADNFTIDTDYEDVS